MARLSLFVILGMVLTALFASPSSQGVAANGCIPLKFAGNEACDRALTTCTAAPHNADRCTSAVNTCAIALYSCRCRPGGSLRNCLESNTNFLTPITQKCAASYSGCNDYLREYAGYIQDCPC